MDRSAHLSARAGRGRTHHASQPPGVILANTVLSDDGYADSNETAEMRPIVRNLSGEDLRDVIALLVTEDPKICVPAYKRSDRLAED